MSTGERIDSFRTVTEILLAGASIGSQGRRMKWFWQLLVACCSACSGVDRSPADRPDDRAELTESDIRKRWIALYVPHVAELPHVVATPSGFFALSREAVGDGKAITARKSYLYRSDDGIHWKFTVLPPPDEPLSLRGIAFGDGRFVIVGQAGPSNIVLTSTDGREWSVLNVDIGQHFLSNVVYAGDRFFVLTTGTTVLSSMDADDWHVAVLKTVQPTDVDHGNGVYVLVGSGPIQYSRDGVRWEARELDCSLPTACITDPSGGVHQNMHYDVVFADRFYVDQFASADGVEWQAFPGPTAELYVGGYLLGRNRSAGMIGQPIDEGIRETVLAFKPGTQPTEIEVEYVPAPLRFGAGAPAPRLIQAPLPRGETCLTHRCIAVENQLYLIP